MTSERKRGRGATPSRTSRVRPGRKAKAKSPAAQRKGRADPAVRVSAAGVDADDRDDLLAHLTCLAMDDLDEEDTR